MKQIFMEGALGERVQSDRLKLSDFIDEGFFDELMDLDEIPPNSKDNLFLSEDLLRKELKPMKNN